jgi:O-antigen ligase
VRPRAERIGFQLYAAQLFTLFGIALSNVCAGVLVLASPWAVGRRGLRRALVPAADTPARRSVDGPQRWLVAALAAYVAFLGLAVATSYDPRQSLGGFSELFTLATLLFGLALVRGERRVRLVVDGLGAVGGLVALWGLAQYLGGYGEIDRRIRGPFSHWMTFSGFLMLCDLLLVAALLFRGRRLREEAGWGAVAWRAAALVAINAALLGSLTRSAWVGLAAGLALAAVLRSPRTLIAFPLGAVAFVLLAPVPLLQRVGSTADLSDPSNYDRLCMAEAGLRMVAERPLTGLGPELVEDRYPIYRTATAPRYAVPHLHNVYMQLAAERGLPALAAYLVLMLAPLAAAWRLYRREGGRRGPRADLLIGVLAALVAFDLAALFEHNWGDTEVQRLALFLMAVPFGLAAADPDHARDPEPEPPIY